MHELGSFGLWLFFRRFWWVGGLLIAKGVSQTGLVRRVASQTGLVRRGASQTAFGISVQVNASLAREGIRHLEEKGVIEARREGGCTHSHGC